MAIWRITNLIEGPGQGGNRYNVFHVRRDTTGPDGNRFIQALEAFYTTLVPLYPGSTAITIGHSIVDVETQEFVEGTPVIVTQPSAENPTSELLQLVVPWRTTVRARRAMGRTFLGPLNSDCVHTNGNPVTAQVDLAETAAAALVSESQSLGLGAFGVYGYENAPHPTDGRQDSDPKVLRDFIGFAPMRRDGFSYLSSRRD